MTGITQTLKRLAQGLAAVSAAAALVTPAALAASNSGNGAHDPWFNYARSLTHANGEDPWFNYAVALTGRTDAGAGTFVTDTLAPGGGSSRPTAPTGYRFITDTLAPGSSSPAAPANTPFDWRGVGIGAGGALGLVLLIGMSSALMLRRRGRLGHMRNAATTNV